MGDFFRFVFRFFDSKRGVGMMLLVVASILTMNWVRTVSFPNDLFVDHKSGRFTLHSENGWIHIVQSPHGDLNVQNVVVLFQFPYWSIVSPLILLSAYLLLGNPRPSTSKKITEPVPEKHR